MRKTIIREGFVCPKCGAAIDQCKAGFNRCGTQRVLCKHCQMRYTVEPKRHAIPDEMRQVAMKELLSGLSGRAVGKIHGMSKANVYNWIKKTEKSVDKPTN